MDAVKIQLAGIWTAVMLTYLLGDVLRIFNGDFKPGEIEGKRMTQAQSLGIAVVMAIPIVMVVLSLLLDYPISRSANIIAAIFFFGFNLLGLPTYPSAYDRFLIILGLVLNGLTIWLAWHWAG